MIGRLYGSPISTLKTEGIRICIAVQDVSTSPPNLKTICVFITTCKNRMKYRNEIEMGKYKQV